MFRDLKFIPVDVHVPLTRHPALHKNLPIAVASPTNTLPLNKDTTGRLQNYLNSVELENSTTIVVMKAAQINEVGPPNVIRFANALFVNLLLCVCMCCEPEARIIFMPKSVQG
jgi:hypothetical protein